MRVVGCLVMGWMVMALAGCGSRPPSSNSSVDSQKSGKVDWTQLRHDVEGAGTAPGSGSEASKRQQLIGVWEPAKGPKTAEGSAVEFTKDGKVKLSFRLGDNDMTREGTYTMNGDRVTLNFGPGQGERQEIIHLLTVGPTKMVAVRGGGSTEEFHRK